MWSYHQVFLCWVLVSSFISVFFSFTMPPPPQLMILSSAPTWWSQHEESCSLFWISQMKGGWSGSHKEGIIGFPLGGGADRGPCSRGTHQGPHCYHFLLLLKRHPGSAKGGGLLLKKRWDWDYWVSLFSFIWNPTVASWVKTCALPLFVSPSFNFSLSD